MSKNKNVERQIGKISAKALRRFAENRRIANKAVQKALEENRKYGITEETHTSQ